MIDSLEVRVFVDRLGLLGRVWLLLMVTDMQRAWHESETKQERAEASTAFGSGFGRLTRK